MAAWSGFSEAELRQMRANMDPKENKNENATQPKQSRSKIQKKKLMRKDWDYTSNEPMSDAMRLSDSEKCRLLPETGSLEKAEEEENGKDETDGFRDVDLKVLEEREVMSMEIKSIEAYQKRQREIEDHNKKKKQLLIDTIEERRRQTTLESSRLKEIQQELSKLDSALSGDVSILRDKIEAASREFMDAQKRYERAELEFVAAKLDLHHKSEIKSGLTEHLHIIIHKNELRRSRKLAELMKKLDMDSSPDTDDVTLTPAQNLMTSVQTLGPSGPGNPNKILLESLGVEIGSQEVANDTRNGSDDVAKNDVIDDVSKRAEMSDTESSVDSPSHKKVRISEQREFVRELSV